MLPLHRQRIILLTSKADLIISALTFRSIRRIRRYRLGFSSSFFVSVNSEHESITDNDGAASLPNIKKHVSQH